MEILEIVGYCYVIKELRRVVICVDISKVCDIFFYDMYFLLELLSYCNKIWYILCNWNKILKLNVFIVLDFFYVLDCSIEGIEGIEIKVSIMWYFDKIVKKVRIVVLIYIYYVLWIEICINSFDFYSIF